MGDEYKGIYFKEVDGMIRVSCGNGCMAEKAEFYVISNPLSL